MAPLGFLQHKDSIVDLASLLEAHHPDCPISSNSNQQQTHALGLAEVGDSAQVAFDSHQDDVDEEEKECSTANVGSNSTAAEAAAQPRIADSTRSSTMRRSLVRETNQAYSDWVEYQNYYDYNGVGYAAVQEHEEGGNLMACLFPWLFASALPSTDTAEQKDDNDDATNAPVATRRNQDLYESPKDWKIAKHFHLASVPEVDETLSHGNPSSPVSPELTTNGPSGLDDDAAHTRKGILKSTKLKSIDGVNKTDPSSKGGKRTLFSTMYTQERSSSMQEEDTTRKVEFSPMARVISIQSSQTLTPAEKASVWWAKQDYADFKKTARLVAKAMLQGGSEVWLMTNPSWKSKGRDSRGGEQKEEPIGDKWWCKFGHSRRGLEHIASPEEGKERQRNVLQSKLAVIQEQKRQQRSHLWMDADRIRQVYVRYNSWSRELCLAAGASDAEAVRSNFRDQGRSRAFYLYKHRSTVDPTSNHVPDFMGRLQLQETKESIHEAPSSAGSMSKKAVGFGVERHVNMASVMSGMGV